jgi:hypothetical protein
VIPVARVPEPAGYDEVKRRGDAWLEQHRHAKRPKDLWSEYLPDLAEGFSNLCGYAAMLDPTRGTVDHYLSWVTRPDLTYEWSNFRFASYLLNTSKRTADDTVLDPYEVQSGWFEIILPSLQMRLTDKVPQAYRAKAELTLSRLKLRDGEKIVQWRRRYYERYQDGSLTLDGLRMFAPLVAEAVEREQHAAARKPVRAAPTAKSKAKPKPKPKRQETGRRKSKGRGRAKTR